ncbi:uncharacterized protein Eint_070520 [Encephalitozoon intestinalis ATCC 50506]|uniref:Uncharacterized protein n=1 Tax=Encephalitozoon intestinalis (strain ATCC 50506) TaxID=876142 RepID=E0S7Y1_ENCIT|nr:uncharacterized protein Eint_070520 [Encephalitozoon intestinalis ATCC 50506]ADM11816.1 hypothetical protein Eint_070520 [Encephalitozoon intestinalis ATCC 50506]UTX45566.1 hypothetical protein GPK93_07g11290 [Encephalitozoon intestinalis]
MKEAEEFPRNSLTSRKACVYTISHAMGLYGEHRKQILRELAVREVQKRITNKILGRKDDDFDLIFLKSRHDTSMDGVCCMSSDDECFSSSKQMEDQDETEAQPLHHSSSSSLGSSSEAKSKSGKSKGFKRFIDLEAKTSEDGESSYEEDGGDSDALSFIASSDEDYEEPSKKHNHDMLEINRNILRKLKKRFIRKPRNRVFFGEEDYTEKASSEEAIEDEDMDVSENTVEDIVESFVFPKEEVEYPPEARCSFTKSEQVEFVEDIKIAEKKLGEGQYTWDSGANGGK